MSQDTSDTPPKKMKDLTSSMHDAQEGDPVDDPVYQKTRRKVIRFGNVLFAAIGFGIFVPMLIGVGQGISSQEVWDPYTGEPVYAKDGDAADCVERGRRLLLGAGSLTSLERSWAEPHREWQMRCRAAHPELSDALQRTRDELRESP